MSLISGPDARQVRSGDKQRSKRRVKGGKVIGPGGRDLSVYLQVKGEVDDLLKAYRDDLIVHDAKWIRENPSVPFLHWTRETGTDLVALRGADASQWPARGERVKFLFGAAGRRKILAGMAQAAAYWCSAVSLPVLKVLWYDGKCLWVVTPEKAQQIVDEYRQRVLREWDKQGEDLKDW